MARMADVRARYASDKVTTSPERLITMLYDRLLVDLDSAEEAMVRGDRETAHRELGHAQAIVLELLASLEQESWSGGAGLAQLYVWMVRHLVNANIHQDTGALQHCRELVTPLRDAWRDAAIQTSPGLGAAV